MYRFEPRWSDRVAWYATALAASALSWCIWSFSPVMHQDPFAIFILAVVFIARFFGFGPAVLCTFSSAVVLDYAMFRRSFGAAISENEFQRLGVFILISFLVAGLARQRSRAETRTDAVRHQMASIVASSQDAIWSFTVDGAVISWNRAAEKLFGYSAEEITGRPVAVLVPPDRLEELAANLARLNREEHVPSYETERIDRNGTRLTILLSLSPLRNEQGKLVGASAIARDVSAQKRTEEALRRNERLATAGRLTAAIAHEIKNPLEALTNLIYLARQDTSGQEEYLRRAEHEIGRLDSIAQQALGLVRENTSPELVDTGKILDEVVQLYLRKLQAARIKLEKQAGERLEILGYPGELRQVFSNLILNAIDAMQDGGRLRLRVVRTHEWSGEGRAGVRVTIADTGNGISPKDLAHIFEPFYTTKKDQGTGLGLWLAYGSVEKHAGWMRVATRTAPGASGTVFSVFLPDSGAQGRLPGGVTSGGSLASTPVVADSDPGA
ncbi:MAG: PAS domain S-box protein [Acidobacteria bacterium]|nr:PAS domain S-box protein [Acidobacteriota bacterium]